LLIGFSANYIHTFGIKKQKTNKNDEDYQMGFIFDFNIIYSFKFWGIISIDIMSIFCKKYKKHGRTKI
jgi:hypothetical protein